MTISTINHQYNIVHAIAGRIRLRLKGIHHNRELAAGLEATLNTQHGVIAAHVNSNCGSVTVRFHPDQFDPLAWFDHLNLSEIHRRHPKADREVLLPILEDIHHKSLALEKRLPPKLQFLLGSLALASSFLELPLLTLPLVSAATLPILNRAVNTLVSEKKLGVDALDSANCIMLIRYGHSMPAALITFLVATGEFIREVVTERTQRMIHHQLQLSERSAWRVEGHSRVRVPVEELRTGDYIVVYPGELITVQGEVIQGDGETVPANPETLLTPHHVKSGDYVLGETVLAHGKLFIRFAKPAEKKVNSLIVERQHRRWLQRTKLHKNALHAGQRKVIPALAIAAMFFAFTRELEGALSIITYDFITGIKIAIPIAVLSAMDKAGRRGVIIRSGHALESLAEVDVILFAGNGTLTAREPTVTDVYVVDGFSLEEVAKYAASVAARYNHLQAYAIYTYARAQTIPVPERTTSELLAGFGINGQVEGHTVLLGRTRMMESHGIDISPALDFIESCSQRGDSRACVAIDGRLAGVIAYKDAVRSGASDMVASLKQLGIEVALTTAGSQGAAESLARKVGIDNVHYRMLPQDQATIVREYHKQGKHVAVVGDDVGDAPALEAADVAITLSSASSDVARYRADVVLNEGLERLAEGIEIARTAMDTARESLTCVTLPNWIGLGLSVTGRISNVTSAVINNGSVLVAACNGLRPLLTDHHGLNEELTITDNESV